MGHISLLPDGKKHTRRHLRKYDLHATWPMPTATERAWNRNGLKPKCVPLNLRTCHRSGSTVSNWSQLAVGVRCAVPLQWNCLELKFLQPQWFSLKWKALQPTYVAPALLCSKTETEVLDLRDTSLIEPKRLRSARPAEPKPTKRQNVRPENCDLRILIMFENVVFV